MILQVLMEEKQLDLNQPLLSVRRYSSAVPSENENKRKSDKPSAKRPPLPAYKSDLKSGPLSNPGTIPFVWERTPGRPKNENKSQTRAVEGPPVTPKLPPGRILKVEQQHFDNVPKGTSDIQSRIESTVSNSMSVASSLDDIATKHEERNENEREKGSSDDGDEAYLDALETLSRTESSFMNCSVSGLSGWDDQEVKPSEGLSADHQALDFMMGRFLPAAKAMASETPQIQYTSRKPLVTQEQQPRQVRKIASGAKSLPMDPKWQKLLPHYAQDISQEESEDESDDNDRDENYAPKVCGLFSRFCILNPIPAVRVEDRILSSASYVVQGKSFASHRTVKAHSRTTHYGKKSVDRDIQSGFAKEKDLDNLEISKHIIDPHRRGVSRLSAPERTQFESAYENPVVEKTLYIDSVHKVKSSSPCSSEMKCPTDHRKDDESLRKDVSIDINPSIYSSIGISKHEGVEDEKATLQPKISSLPACYDNSSDDMQMKNHSNKIYSKKLELTKPGYQGNNLDKNSLAISRPEMVERKKIGPENEVYSSKKNFDGLKFDSKSQHGAKFVKQKCADNDNPSSLGTSKKNQLPMKLGHRVTSDSSSLKHPLALPSPKAPSESWLKRTLPTVSSRSIPAARIYAPTEAPKPADPKWEIIVKSSNVHHGHMRFAEELTPIPEA